MQIVQEVVERDGFSSKIILDWIKKKQKTTVTPFALNLNLCLMTKDKTSPWWTDRLIVLGSY